MARHRTCTGATTGTTTGTPAVLLATLLACAAALVLPSVGARAAAAQGPWRWPLDPQPRVLSHFQGPSGPFASGHRGADLAARVGQPVRSPGPGTVAFAGIVAGRGVVSVEHPGGRRTTYEPVIARVDAGRAVAAGDLLGTVSAAPGHCLPATCLHWGLRLGDAYLDPLRLVGAVWVRLLPVRTGPGPPTGLLRDWRPGLDRGPLLVRDRGMAQSSAGSSAASRR